MKAPNLLVFLKFKVKVINGICGATFKKDPRKVQCPVYQLYEAYIQTRSLFPKVSYSVKLKNKKLSQNI